MAQLRFEAVAVVGERDGKKVYQKLGTVWESDKGLSLKLDVLPVGVPGWNGWVSFYEPKPKQGVQTQGKPAGKAPDVFEDDNLSDVPF